MGEGEEGGEERDGVEGGRGEGGFSSSSWYITKKLSFFPSFSPSLPTSLTVFS